ncbi:unnamed protein product [Sphagnum tenellum]
MVSIMQQTAANQSITDLFPKFSFCFSVICFVGQVRLDPTGDDQLPPHLLDTVQLQSKPVKLCLIDHNGQGSMFYSDICHGLQAIGEFKAGKVEFQADKTGIVHVLFGKSDLPADDLLNFVDANKPTGANGVTGRQHMLHHNGPLLQTQC